MARTSYAVTIVHWENLDTRVQSNKPALDHLEPLRAQLEVERLGLVEATNRSARLKFESLAATRDIEGYLSRGNEAATRLRDALRAHFGRAAENLAEFGLQPRRARTSTRKSKKKSAEAGPTPDQKATSETDGAIQK